MRFLRAVLEIEISDRYKFGTLLVVLGQIGRNILNFKYR